MKTLKSLLRPALLLSAGSFLLALSGFNWHYAVPVWFGLAFLIRYSRENRWPGIIVLFLFLSVTGGISQTGNNLFNLPVINLYNGLTFGILELIFFLPDRFLHKRIKGFFQTLVFPLTVVLVEGLVSLKMGTWGIIAHSQYAFKPLLGICYPAGPEAVSFMVAWFASSANWVYENRSGKKKAVTRGLIYTSVLLLVLLYGGFRFMQINKTGDAVLCAAVKGETDLHGDIRFAMEDFLLSKDQEGNSIPESVFSSEIMIDTMISRTIQACNSGAKIIAWNESSLILSAEASRHLMDTLAGIAASNSCFILPAFLTESIEGPKPADNIAVLLGPEGKQLFRYRKSYLHPIAEAPVMNPGNFELPVVETEYGRIGVVICVDLDLPRYLKQAKKDKVDILLVPAYDWPGIDPLHSQMAVVAAITEGVDLLRPNGCGKVTGFFSGMADFKDDTISIYSYTPPSRINK